MAEDDDHFIFEVVDAPHKKSGKAIKVSTPEGVHRIESKDELVVQLAHYSHPFIRHTVMPKTKFARKHYVEKTRPALRYYCKKYQVEVPAWLANEDYFVNLPEKEKLELFGTSTLSIREFTPLVHVPMTVEQEP
jgi:hypothetical protein